MCTFTVLVSDKLISSLTLISKMIHPFFMLPLSFVLFSLYPSPELSTCTLTGCLSHLFADSALCPPSGSPIIVLRVDIGHRQRKVCSGRETKKECLPSGRWGTVQTSAREQRQVIFSSFCLLAGSVLACEDGIQSSSFHSAFLSLSLHPTFLLEPFSAYIPL